MNEAEELRKKLFNIREDGWVKASQEEKDSIFKYADEYINFLNKGKTEREIVAESREIAEQNGFKNLETMQELKAGDKVYFVNREW